jgi:hypothetical protein
MGIFFACYKEHTRRACCVGVAITVMWSRSRLNLH